MRMPPTASSRELAARSASRRAVTLFEIAISLLVMSAAVTSAALLFPVGLRAQQVSRFQLYAGVKMIQLAEQYSAQDHQFLRRQTEAEKLGQSSFTYSHLTDLEYAETGAHPNAFGMPVPDVIARRFDSDGDEIARILDEGGHIYYSSPRPAQASFWNEWSEEDVLVQNDVQKVVFGIVGYPQQDALVSHPCISWPYFEYHPAPPIEASYGGVWPEIDTWSDNAAVPTWTAAGEQPPAPGCDPFPRAPWPGLTEAQQVCAAWKIDADAMILACQDLISATGVAVVASAGGPVPIAPAPLPSGPWSPTDDQVFPKPYQVLALRFLAFATAWRTDPTQATPANAVQRRYAQDCFDAAMRWARRYGAANPYDWGAWRASQAITAFDYPLLQFDLFPAALSAPAIAEIDHGGGDVDRSWKVIGPLRPTSFGRARGHHGYANPIPPNHGAIAASFGDESHFTLAQPFAAAERCREIVFWAVDWQSYVDFESAPSARFDSRNHNLDSLGEYVTHGDFAMNPEREYVWSTSARTPVSMTWHGQLHYRAGYSLSQYPDPDWLLGNWGADRNGNGRFDSGTIPAATRLRAQRVASFDCYDQRILTSVKF